MTFDMVSEEGFNPEMPLRCYMRLDYLIDMLERKAMYAKQKKSFVDKFESSLPFLRLLPIYEFHTKPSREQVEKDIAETQMKLQQYAERGNLYASCWTTREHESMLMWNCYAQKIGACVKTTLGQFLQSVCDDRFTITHGSMAYGSLRRCLNDAAFSKVLAYEDEHEYRFYFVPKDGSEQHESGIHVKVDTSTMIKELVLSPYISARAASALCRLIGNEYKCKATVSQVRF